MDDELARARFATAPVAVLATIAGNGSPRLVPVTFAAVGDRVVISIDHKPKTRRRLARLDDIDGDARVSLLAQHYDDDWMQLWWVRASGTAAVARSKDAIAEAAELLVAKYPQYQEHPPAGPVIDITIESWRSWEASTG